MHKITNSVYCGHIFIFWLVLVVEGSGGFGGHHVYELTDNAQTTKKIQKVLGGWPLVNLTIIKLEYFGSIVFDSLISFFRRHLI